MTYGEAGRQRRALSTYAGAATTRGGREKCVLMVYGEAGHQKCALGTYALR